MFHTIKCVHQTHHSTQTNMETQLRCKGCKNYLSVAAGRPCPICYTVTKPNYKKTSSHIVQFIDDYANRPSNNYYNGVYEQPQQTPAFGGYDAPPEYGPGYYRQPPPISSSLTTYSGGYGTNNRYPPQPSYSRPEPQTWSPSMYHQQLPEVHEKKKAAYGPGYYRQPPPISSSPTMYSDGYGTNNRYSPQPSYSRPEPQTLSPSMYHQQSPEVHEKKKAVLCGVTYKGHRKTLTASINNVRSMHQLLVKLGFPNGSIRVLTEEESDPARIPTRRNILMALEWLTKGCRSGDSLVFYYAGHGCYVPHENGDEKDGYDEALCPVDYSVSGKILDDEINAAIVAPLPHGAILHSIMDTCFSGTLLDLPFLCRIDRGGFYKWEDHHPSHESSYGGTSGGKAVCISACDDHQNSADTSVFTGDSIGALTYSFIQAVQSARKLKYGDLLDNMRKIVREAQQKQGVDVPFASSKSQEPQLSCSTRFEIYSEPFML